MRATKKSKKKRKRKSPDRGLSAAGSALPVVAVVLASSACGERAPPPMWPDPPPPTLAKPIGVSERELERNHGVERVDEREDEPQSSKIDAGVALSSEQPATPPADTAEPARRESRPRKPKPAEKPE